MKIVGDFSSYQRTLTLAKMKLFKDSGMSGAIIRACVSLFEDQWTKTVVGYCRALGIPFGFYGYPYPGQGADAQAKLLIKVMASYPDSKIAFCDIEEHAWNGTEYSLKFLDAFYKSYYVQVENYQNTVQKLAGNYSAAWVMDKYLSEHPLDAKGNQTTLPVSAKWISQEIYWNAHYVKYFQWWRDYLASIGASWDSDIHQIPITYLPQIMETIWSHRSEMFIPKGITKVHLWQCITFIPFEELGTYEKHQDYSVCSDEDFAFLFDKVVQPEPVPDQYKVTARLGLLVRYTPPVNGVKGNVVGYRLYGQTVTVTQIIDSGDALLGKWGEIGTGQWVSMAYLVAV